MTTEFPTAAQLRCLTLRAILFLVVRNARRISGELRGVIPHADVDDLLLKLEVLPGDSVLARHDPEVLIRCVSKLVETFRAVSSASIHSKWGVIRTLVQTSLLAMNVVLAARNPDKIEFYMQKIINAATRALRPLQSASSTNVAHLVVALLEDYHLLICTYGVHADVVLGDPVIAVDDVMK